MRQRSKFSGMVPIDFDSVDVERVEAENIDVFAFKKVEVE